MAWTEVADDAAKGTEWWSVKVDAASITWFPAPIGTIGGAVATAGALAPVPTVSTQSSVAVAPNPAVATEQARNPSVNGSAAASVSAITAASTDVAQIPTVTAAVLVTVAGVAAADTALASAPAVSSAAAVTNTGAGFEHADLYTWAYTPSTLVTTTPGAGDGVLDTVTCSNSTQLNTALTTAAAGDLIWIDTAGTYEVDNPTITGSGTVTNPIWLMADPALGADAVKINHTGGNGTNMMKFEGLSYWRIYNIFFDDTASVYQLNIGNFDQANNDLPVQPAHACDHFIVQSCKFQRSNQTSIKIVNQSNNIQIIDCIFDDWTELASSVNLGEAIYIGKGCTPNHANIDDNIDSCNAIDIIGCEFTDSTTTAIGGECVDAKFGTYNMRLLHNEVHGVTFSSGAVSGIFGLSANYNANLTAVDMEAAYNRFYDCDTQSTSEPSCFLIGGGGADSNDGLRIHHNLAKGMPVSFIATTDNFTSGFTNVYVYNNECWDMNNDVTDNSWRDRGTIGDAASASISGTYTGDDNVVEATTGWPTDFAYAAVIGDFEGPTTGTWTPTSGSYQFALGGMEPDPAQNIPSTDGAFTDTGSPLGVGDVDGQIAAVAAADTASAPIPSVNGSALSPSVDESTFGNDLGASPVTIDWDNDFTDLQADDVLVLIVAAGGATTASDATISGETFSTYGHFGGNAYQPKISVFTKVLAGTETGTFTADSNQAFSVTALKVRSADTTTPIEANATINNAGHGAATSITTNAVTTVTDNALVVQVLADSNAQSTIAVSTGYTEVIDQLKTVNRGQMIGTKLVATAGSEDPSDVTFPSSGNAATIALAIKPA